MGNNLHAYSQSVTREMREKLHRQKGKVFWFTGLSGSGKSTLANALEKKFHQLGYKTMLLDGDNIRTGLCKDLGFSAEDRKENIRRISEVSKILLDSGTIVLTAFISPFKEDREEARQIIGEDFIEVFVDAPLSVCESRDPKGLYKKARLGQIPNFTGIDSPYESPESPEITVETEALTISKCVEALLGYYTDNFQNKEVNSLDKRKTIAIDFDGVIHKYSRGFKGLDNAYDEPSEGTREALTELKSQGYSLKIFSSRPAPVIQSWLEKYDMSDLIDDVSNFKFPAHIYIDDRGFRFESWKQINEILNIIK
jgi:adenylyl-sulfate kinase